MKMSRTQIVNYLKAALAENPTKQVVDPLTNTVVSLEAFLDVAELRSIEKLEAVYAKI